MRTLTSKSKLRIVRALIVAALFAGAVGAQPSDLPPLAGFPSTQRNPAAPCTCGTARGMSGWCERHGIGYVADVKIRSWLLYEQMDAHGHAMDMSRFLCPVCQKAYESEGFCEEHKIGFVGKMGYFSRLTFELARADQIDPGKITCPTCRKNARGHGWCETHQTGMVTHFAIRGRERYRLVEKALDTLELANRVSERCEQCALAIVADGRCPFHKITYKDGHEVPASEGAPAPATLQ